MKMANSYLSWFKKHDMKLNHRHCRKAIKMFLRTNKSQQIKNKLWPKNPHIKYPISQSSHRQGFLRHSSHKSPHWAALSMICNASKPILPHFMMEELALASTPICISFGFFVDWHACRHNPIWTDGELKLQRHVSCFQLQMAFSTYHSVYSLSFLLKRITWRVNTARSPQGVMYSGALHQAGAVFSSFEVPDQYQWLSISSGARNVRCWDFCFSELTVQPEFRCNKNSHFKRSPCTYQSVFNLPTEGWYLQDVSPFQMRWSAEDSP